LRTALIPVLAIVFVLTAATEAGAGTARSGQVTPGKGSRLSKAAQKLVGTWRLVAIEVGTTRRPFPGSQAFTVSLRSDGTVSVKNFPQSQAKKFDKARWKVKGKYVLLTLNKKVQKFGYFFKANELSVSVPGNNKYRLIMVRVLKKMKP
jgi:hypothetical protein